MLKKILLVVSLFCLIAFAVPALAEYPGGDKDYLEQSQFGVNLLLTGLVINPVDIGYSEFNDSCFGDYGMDFGLYWGGMSIDVLAIQVIGQTQSLGKPCCYNYVSGQQEFRNELILKSPGFNLRMIQESRQSAYADKGWYMGW